MGNNTQYEETCLNLALTLLGLAVKLPLQSRMQQMPLAVFHLLKIGEENQITLHRTELQVHWLLGTHLF